MGSKKAETTSAAQRFRQGGAVERAAQVDEADVSHSAVTLLGDHQGPQRRRARMKALKSGYPRMMSNRRLVVIGGSAGGLGPLREIVGGLSASFPAPVLVCLHLGEGSTSRLPEILEDAGSLPARHPRHGDRLEPGVIFVAPPDRHLVVNDDDVHLSRGPTENRHRPAVDTLFNSAARWHGPDVIGVVLSGALDDGAAGAAAIAAHYGTVMVQDPEEARISAMPLAAARVVPRALVAPVAQVASLLATLATEEPISTQRPPLDPLVMWEREREQQA